MNRRLLTLPFVWACAACDASNSGEPAGEEHPFVADVFCGTRFRVRKVDLLNEGAANHEIERGQANACWRFVVGADGTLSLFERIPSTVAGKPDGYCRVQGRKISNFQAESTGGECLWYEAREDDVWQVRMTILPEGEMQISNADRLDTSLDTTLVMTNGDIVYTGRGALFHGGGRDEHPAFDPGSETEDLAGDVSPCALDGCWTGTLELVDQELCPEDGMTPPVGETLRWTVDDDRSVILFDGETPSKAFADADRCASLANQGPRLYDHWRVSIALVEDDRVEIGARWVPEQVPCRRTLRGTWSRCE